MAPLIISAAIGHERRALGRVFVLSGDLSTRTLELPAANVAAMSAEELRHALAFEAEPLTGLPASEATTTRVMRAVYAGVTNAMTSSGEC